MNNIPCEVIRDLLPSYVDKLTSEVTNDIVKAHLKECKECAGEYERMITPEKVITGDDEKEVAFLKKQKNKVRKAIIGGVLATILCVIVVIGIKAFAIGKESNPHSLAIECNVNDRIVDLKCELLNAAPITRITGISFDVKDGRLNITVREAMRLPFGGNTSVNGKFEANEEFNEICLNGRLIWQDGVKISTDVEKLYRYKNEYVGNASADVNLAYALGIKDTFGEFTNELHTSEEPYGWTLSFSGELNTKKSKEDTEELLTKCGTVLLSMVGNLSYVEFKYIDNGEEVTVKVTSEDASAYIGTDVKKAAESVADLQRLIKLLGIMI
ncbi:MAG: DUF4825 domain-containing protein [Lachnospiraceae bacterium]|nr:DUF4825 domain-containing protein [Lachnospiraceae bacterium]